MLEKIKSRVLQINWQQFRDVRLLGFVVFGVMMLLASWSGVRVIQTNFELQKEVAQLSEQNKIHELENANLNLRNQYYTTDTYLELTARKQLGKGAPGETLILVPKSVALAHAKELPVEKPADDMWKMDIKKPFYQQNFEAWMDFFFHRGQS
jgi:cell division protein FtsB